MKKRSFIYTFLLLVSICLSGCGAIGEKMTSMSIIYAITAVAALLLLIVFNCVIHKKDVWYQLLFASIFIVNLGYFTLSISKTLEEALLANRISYLGSVFLPMSMYLLILNVSNIKYRKWLPIILLTIGIGMFLIAASPGYSDIYYKEVFLTIKNGATVLKKVYGPLHSIYLYYLLGYFSVMLITLIYTTVRKKIASNIQAVMLLCAVLINIFVWLSEQLVHIDFEILSVSYIISELFLISLQLMATANTNETEPEKAPEIVKPASGTIPVESPKHEVIRIPEEEPDFMTEAPVISEDQMNLYLEGLSSLTPTERVIYNLYISGNSTKEIMASLNIKENTLKFHNKNIYGKLGVTSRKQLIELSKQLDKR
ncbi:MAG: hypothetical protein IKU20_06795 [Lachnospiraceae bacterium]|nr:hypothetical protein [Lachnospiraceae bacterium]